ncbi:S-adenosyl-L-methionine-dependent methyltransferase [Sporodiniella umbellata]|nr:S-adenosyl-L-methionine-dependent methyltransferase [Sporodiniella umbellata]
MGIKQSRYHRQKQSAPRRESLHTNHTVSELSQSTQSRIIEGRQYHNDQTSTYILPKDEIEQDRLNSQHFAVKALFSQRNILGSIEKSLPNNSMILDIGCGTGCWVMEMAVDYPEHNFKGVDLSDMFPTTIRPENAEFELVNVLGGLPFEDNTFDFVNMRFMMTAFSTSEWPIIINEIHRVLKTGGMVELMENVFPEKARSPIVEAVNQQFYEMLKENEKEPLISTQLDTLLQQGNFKIIERQEKCLQYKTSMGPLGRELVDCWKLAILALKPLLARRLVQDPDTYDALIDKYVEGLLEDQCRTKIVAYSAQKLQVESIEQQQDN